MRRRANQSRLARHDLIICLGCTRVNPRHHEHPVRPCRRPSGEGVILDDGLTPEALCQDMLSRPSATSVCNQHTRRDSQHHRQASTPYRAHYIFDCCEGRIVLTMDGEPSTSSGLRPTADNNQQPSDQSFGRSPSNQHITMEEPTRPLLPKRNTFRGESTRSMSEALRLARSREEQETLLGDEEQADDDGCYPPRNIGDPLRVPNPHRSLPVYTTIHKIRRLIIASIGMAHPCLLRCSRARDANA